MTKFNLKTLHVLSFSVGLLIALSTQRDHLGLSLAMLQTSPTPTFFSGDPGMRALSPYLSGSSGVRIGEVSEAGLQNATQQNLIDQRLLNQAQQPYSDPLPGALTPQFMASMHTFDPNLGSPFAANQWATMGKMTPLSMNTYSRGLYDHFNTFRAEGLYDFSMYDQGWGPNSRTVQVEVLR